MIIQSHVLQGDARRDTGVDQSESLPRPRLRRTRRPAGPRQLGCAPCGRLTCSSSGNSTASAAMMEHRSGPQVRTIGGYVNRKGPAGFSGEDRDHGPALSPRRIGSNRPAGERTRSTTPGAVFGDVARLGARGQCSRWSPDAWFTLAVTSGWVVLHSMCNRRSDSDGLRGTIRPAPRIRGAKTEPLVE